MQRLGIRDINRAVPDYDKKKKPAKEHPDPPMHPVDKHKLDHPEFYIERDRLAREKEEKENER